MTSALSKAVDKVRSSKITPRRPRKAAESSLSTIASGGGDALSLSTWGSQGIQNRNSQIYAQLRNWIYVCSRAVAQRVAGQAVCAGVVTNADQNPDSRASRLSQKEFERSSGKTFGRRVKLTESQEVEVFQEHGVLDFLAQPNHVQRETEFLHVSALNLLLTGECYWIVGENGDGELESWAVPTTWITPEHKGSLFSGYRLKIPNSSGEGIPLESSQVARTYFPDPADPKRALAPALTQWSAIRIDDRIQGSQEQMFERGIFPNVAITVGQTRGPDGKPTGKRPILKGHQRRQIIRAVRQVWNETVNAGDPAIIDGLIESIHKLQTSPQEMDWMESGEQVKKRIFQAFHVNPIVVGEIAGVNRAQAAVADAQFCSMAVNPIISALTKTATSFFGPRFEENKRLLVWIEQCAPLDESLELQKWNAARDRNDVSRNEYRAQVLGIAPLDDKAVSRSPLMEDASGLTSTAGIVAQVNAGQMDPEQGSLIIQEFLGLDKKLADDIAGVGIERPDPVPAVPAIPPDPDPDAELLDDDEDLEMASYGDMVKMVADSFRADPQPLSRDGVKRVAATSADELEGRMSHSLARFFPGGDQEG